MNITIATISILCFSGSTMQTHEENQGILQEDRGNRREPVKAPDHAGAAAEDAGGEAAPKNKSLKDITGKKFGRLTVLGLGFWKVEPSGRRKAMWECICSCGKIKTYNASCIKSLRTKSCGCLLSERMRAICLEKTKHGHARHGSETPEYMAWHSMRCRCLNEGDASYPNYGGRGIVICDRWLGSFEAFYADMGRRPSGHHSIDRINNDGNYEPGNCRWATRREQMNNRRTCHRIEFMGRSQTIAQWCRELNLKHKNVRERIRRGWTTAKALV